MALVYKLKMNIRLNQLNSHFVPQTTATPSATIEVGGQNYEEIIDQAPHVKVSTTLTFFC